MSQYRGAGRVAAALVGAGLLLAGCGNGADDTGTGADSTGDSNGAAGPAGDAIDVVTAFYPLHFLSEQVGADLITLHDLTPSGADPHDLELSPVDVALMEQADVVVYLSGFQPAVDAAVDQISGPVALDLADVVDLQDTSATVRSMTHAHDHGDESHDHNADHDHDHAADHDHDHGPLDPHFWLDPDRMARAGEAIATTLGQAAPEHTDAFDDGAARMRTDLEDLDQQYREALATCTDEVMVVSHLAFGYLAQRYDLSQVGIAGLDPETEPAPAHLAEIRQVVRSEDVSTIFVDPLASPRVSEALAEELDLQVRTLDSLENQHDPDSDYFQVMQDNLQALTTGLECS